MFAPLWKPVTNGFIALFCETRWTLSKKFRQWEIRQLQKGLNEEYRTLGELVASALAAGNTFDPQETEADLCLLQIKFLQDEITHLEAEMHAAGLALRADCLKPAEKA